MIKWLKNKIVSLDSITVEKGFKARLKAQHVIDLAASIKASGLIELPVIDSDKHIVAGRDRLAALMLNKVERHEVRVCSGSAADKEILTIEENYRRRRNDDYAAQASRLVALGVKELGSAALDVATDGELPAARPEKSAKAPKAKGRPKGAKGKAIEAAAKKLNRTPEAIRSATRREEAKEEAKEVALGHVPWPAPVDMFDLEPTKAQRDNEFPAIRATQEVLRQAGRAVDKVLRELTAVLTGTENPIQGTAYARTYEYAKALAETIRRADYDSVCPACKDLPHRKATCGYCQNVGYVSSHLIDGCAPELLQRGENAVVSNGKGGLMPVGSPVAVDAPAETKPQKASKPAKGGRKLTVQVEKADGTVEDFAPQVAPPDDDQIPM